MTNDVLIDAFTRIKEVVHDTVEELSTSDLIYRPSDDANSIAWLVWHLSRVQDDHMSELAGHEQTWTADDWYEQFGMPFGEDATGYGQSSSDVAKVQATPEQLLGYHDAVYDKTVTYIKTLSDADYTKVIDTSWNPPVTIAIRIVSVISDDLQHCGQAAYVRGLLGK